MAAVLKVASRRPEEVVAPDRTDPRELVLRFHGPRDDGVSETIRQFREGALTLLREQRSFRAITGYSTLLEAVMKLAMRVLEECNTAQKTRVLTRLMLIFKMVTEVEINDLELVTAELQAETAIRLSHNESSERQRPRRCIADDPGPQSGRRTVKRSGVATKLQGMILKKLNALRVECEKALAQVR